MPNDHRRWRHRHTVALSLAGFLAGAWLGWVAYEFLAIDTCLDRGGAWGGWYCRFR